MWGKRKKEFRFIKSHILIIIKLTLREFEFGYNFKKDIRNRKIFFKF